MNILIRAAALAFAALVLFIVAVQIRATVAGGHYIGLRVQSSGFLPDRGVVTRINPAARTTVRVGDEVLFSQVDPVIRTEMRIGGRPQAFTVPILREGRPMRAAITPTSAPLGIGYGLALAVPILISLALGLFVVLRNPSVATFALLYGAAGTPVAAGLAENGLAFLPDAVWPFAAQLTQYVFQDLPALGLVAFLALYPRPTRASITAAAAACLMFAAYEAVAMFAGLYQSNDPLFIIPQTLLVTALVPIFAVWNYQRSDGLERRRSAWILAGVVVADAGLLGVNLASILGIPRQVFVAGGYLTLAVPAAFAYAILRHRVLDIGFAVNRTVVFGTITALVVAMVALVDWLAGRLLSGSRLATFVEAGITIAIGFALNSIHARLERVVDRIVFRSRYVAERRIEHRIEALGFARDERTIVRTLSTEASGILGLRWAVTYAPDGATYAMVDGCGPHDAAAFFAADDLLVRTLVSKRSPIVTEDLAIDTGSISPHILAVPITRGQTLAGFTLYGPHADGSLPDPEEIALLGRLANAAAAALVDAELTRLRGNEVPAFA